MRIVSVAQLRALERDAFATGTSPAALQDAAARVVAEVAASVVDTQLGRHVVILVGRGNNGRDGAIAGRYLASAGCDVRLILTPGHALQDDELGQLRAGGVSVVDVGDPAEAAPSFESADLAIDALVGIGAHGALREPLAGFARALNVARGRRGGSLLVLALDLPSGIDPETGDVPGDAIEADVTVTVGAVKAGLLRFPAARHVGRLVPRAIGLDSQATEVLPYGLLVPGCLRDLLPARSMDAHKYSMGRVLVVAGSERYPGAAALCAAAAARSGAGLVTLAAPAPVGNVVAARRPEVTHLPLDTSREDTEDALAALRPYLSTADALVVGPGLGREMGTVRFVRALLAAHGDADGKRRGLVLDADALFALADWPEWWRELPSGTVLTPHAGELLRLRGAVQETPRAAWEEATTDAVRWRCVLVAKGPFTVVAEPSGRAEVWPWANPALASGGTGDVLAGLCGGLLAQGASSWDSARLAVGAHALAARAIVDERQWHTLLADDLVGEIPSTLARIARGGPVDPSIAS